MVAPLGLVAGQGDLPVDLAIRAEREGRPLFVVRLAGLASQALDRLPGTALPIERPGDVLAALKAAGCRQVLFAGKVRRPPLWKMKPDRYAWQALLLFVRGIWRRDDSLHRAIASILQGAGLTVVGPDELWPDLLAPQGTIGRRVPSAEEWADIEAADAAALRVGLNDRGQAAVARSRKVIAVEGPGHTKAMLAKAARSPGEGGALVKRAKPQQDRRVDLPVIGPETIKEAVRARLSGIAVEAGGAILTRREETIRQADEAGLFLVGLPRTPAA